MSRQEFSGFGAPIPLEQVTLRAFKRELQIIMDAAHRVACDQGLAWDDYDRLHQAWGHCMKVMEVAYGQSS